MQTEHLMGRVLISYATLQMDIILIIAAFWAYFMQL